MGYLRTTTQRGSRRIGEGSCCRFKDVEGARYGYLGRIWLRAAWFWLAVARVRHVLFHRTGGSTDELPVGDVASRGAGVRDGILVCADHPGRLYRDSRG